MNDHALHFVTSAEIARTEPLGQALLALNNAHAQELSWLEPERLEYLVSEAFLARRIGDLDAFMLAFDQGARYDSPNYLWFRNRYQRFVYIDRIVGARLRAAALSRSVRACGSRRTRPCFLRGQFVTAKSDLGRVPRGTGIYGGRHRERPWRRQNGPLSVARAALEPGSD
jgi:hypothetical protein